jgi:hypothetical protein
LQSQSLFPLSFVTKTENERSKEQITIVTTKATIDPRYRYFFVTIDSNTFRRTKISPLQIASQFKINVFNNSQ